LRVALDDAIAELPEKYRSALRAVEVLEHINTPGSREVLTSLARGAAHARLTREAQTALLRLH
jgi:hypothetical protein